jgi:transposase
VESIQHPAVIGVDPHVDTLSAAAVDPAGAVMWDTTVDNTTIGIRDLIAQVNGPAVLWAIEGTGTFGRALCDRLLATGHLVREVPTRLTGRHRSRSGFGKTDRGDAAAIARAGLADPLAGVTHHPVCETLRIYTRQREALVRSQVRALNRIRARLRELDPDTERTMGRLRNKTTLTGLANYPYRDTGDSYHAALVTAIRIDAGNWLIRYHQIRQLVTDIRSVLPEAGHALMGITGIGLIGAATIIAVTGSIDRFSTEGHYARYCGTAPLDASSGRNQHHRLNRWGNRAVNRVLHTAIITQLARHGDAYHYVNRRIKEGKTKSAAIRAVERHLNKNIYRLLKQHPLT